jgi:hypothetical protein
MKSFERLFDGASFKKGTAIDFSASGKGKLVTKIDGQQVRGRAGHPAQELGSPFGCDLWIVVRLHDQGRVPDNKAAKPGTRYAVTFMLQ